MVLKNDGHNSDFCHAIDANEDSSSTLLASECRRDEKGLEQDNDVSFNDRSANEVKEIFCSGTDKDDRSESFETGLANSLGQGGEAADLRSNPGSPRLGYAAEDRLRELRKHNQSASPSKNHGKNEKVMLSNDVTEPVEKCESSLQTFTEDDVDESDVEEEDVKVCDICGDAGREDLLAVCCRCSDGAEHTYCMRVMLEKVPEGDWFCEECEFNEELERRQEHLKLLGTIERSRSLGRTTSVNSEFSPKLENKDSFCERSKLKTFSVKKQLPSKRTEDSFEAGPTAKKQALESSTGSPTALSPSRVLSKDSSFRNLDKTKGKSINQLSMGIEAAVDASENPRSPTRNSPQSLKGNLLKSNSFNSNSKANVKVSEVLQKQKQGVDAKDGQGKLIAKSMSFKGLGRSSASEPKVKMLSPKCAPVQELKGQKQVRDRTSFERKNSIKLDSFPVQTAANSTKRHSRVDNTSTLTVSNSRDHKNAQSDGKLNSLSKPACHVAHKSQESMATLGEVKRSSSTNSRGSGISSSVESKPSHVSLKDVTTLSSARAVDGSIVGANGAKADMHDNQNEKGPENTFGRSRQGVNGASVSGNRRGISADASLLRAKDGLREDNKLKAAIEAAMQKKQDIFKKNKLPEKLNELSVLNTQGNHVGDGVSNQAMDVISEETVYAREAGLSNYSSNSCKHTSIGSAKQLKVYPADFVEDPILTKSAIPELDAVWQGGFEIHRNGKLADVCGGFQAHLSSFASGKVLEVVRKLPPKMVLNEVSRPGAWPFQFKEAGAQDDNIALYFFAKDPESYSRSYKILLEYMMKHDLALRGNINGAELLIFPSNHLAHRSQRWNTLFFMWGVFRGRRAHGPDDRYASLERAEISVSVPNTIPRVRNVASAASLPVNTCLQKPAIDDLSALGSDAIVSRSEAPVLDGSSLQKSGCMSNGDCYDQGRNVGRTGLTSPNSQGNLEKWPRKDSSVIGAEACLESRTAALEDHGQPDPNITVQYPHSTQEVDSSLDHHESKKSLSDLMLEKQDNNSSKVLMVGKQEGCSVFSSEELYSEKKNVEDKFKNIVKEEDPSLDNIQKNGGQVKVENIVKQEKDNNKDSMWKNGRVELESKGSLKQEGYVDINVSADGSMEDLHSLQYSPKTHSYKSSLEPKSEAASVIPCQKRPWMDSKDVSEGGDQSCISKRIKGDDGFYGCDLRRFPNSLGDRITAQIHDVSTSSRIEDTSNEAMDEKATSVNSGSAERCFFLVDSHAAQGVPSNDRSSPWKVSLLGNEDRLPDGSPNLELALGVEKKQSRNGLLPFFAGIVDRKGPDRPPDIASPKEEDEDASASLSLSLAFPFSDMESPGKSVRPLTTLEQALPARHEGNTSLLLFRNSSGK